MRDLTELGIFYRGKVIERKPATLIDIAEFEKKHGVKLPTDYISFVSKMNGGTPTLNWLETKGKEAFELEAFYHLSGDDTDYYSVSRASKAPSEALGRTVVAIAGDGSGDELILDPTAASAKVKWWRHDTRDEPELVAESFADLLDKLVKSPYSDESDT